MSDQLTSKAGAASVISVFNWNSLINWQGKQPEFPSSQCRRGERQVTTESWTGWYKARLVMKSARIRRAVSRPSDGGTGYSTEAVNPMM